MVLAQMLLYGLVDDTSLSLLHALSGSQPTFTIESALSLVDFTRLTPQFTGGKKQSEERTALFAVRVKLSCYVFICHDTFPCFALSMTHNGVRMGEAH
jgi:hypothetical protein